MRTTRRATLVALPAATALLVQPRRGTAAEVKERTLGRADAPVTMVEYASLTCPHCAAFHKELFPAIKERYVDTGKLRFVFRDFPLDQNALKASVVAHCAGDARYFNFLAALFASQRSWARSDTPETALRQLAAAGGLGKETVEACFADKAMEDAVLRSRLDAQNEFQISSTPSFLLNGKVYAGDRTIEGMSAAIDALLPPS